ncbi:MAG: serine/threonine-protein kinase [Gemmataceae bacterium]
MDDSSSMLHLERFEREWRSRPPADLDAHLPPRGSPGRREILLDLVHVDLEYRWKAGLGRRVEDYLDRYPELRPDPDAVVRLAAWEFELRRRTEPDLEPGEYARRFPDQAPELAERLAEVSTVYAPRSASVPAETGPPEIPGYEVLEELGRGGMGVVYKAKQVALDRLVALKVIRAELSPHPAARQRFAAEARAIARLDHSGIVRVHESGLHGGQPYFVLEYVAGGSLAERLRRGPLPPRRAADLVARLADAVQHAHEQGVVHRDLKPANVLLPGPTVGEGVERGAFPRLGLGRRA